MKTTCDVAMRFLYACNESYNKKLTFVTSQTLSKINLFKITKFKRQVNLSIDQLAKWFAIYLQDMDMRHLVNM